VSVEWRRDVEPGGSSRWQDGMGGHEMRCVALDLPGALTAQRRRADVCGIYVRAGDAMHKGMIRAKISVTSAWMVLTLG
jgi:hypothetical protein